MQLKHSISEITILVISLILCGCNAEKEQYDTVEETEIVAIDTVLLDDVHPPKYCDDFATLTGSSGKTTVVSWGISIIKKNVMWNSSGYPGFGYPMIIELQSEFPNDNIVYVTTQWGRYNYEYCYSGKAFPEDDNLVDEKTGQTLVNWGKLGEFLVLWDSATNHYQMYLLKGGTEIVLE